MSFFKSFFGNDEKPSEASKVQWNYLTEIDQLSTLEEESKEQPVVIFKHSTRCIISRTALKQFENQFDLHEKVKPYFLDLLEYRPISNEIALRFNVMHQSPQIIVLKDGVSVYDASHDAIDAEDLKKFV